MTGRSDLAALVSMLVARLRAAGVATDPLGASALAAALPGVLAAPGDRRSSLYWTARITLVRDPRDFDAYNRVFEDLVGVRPDADISKSGRRMTRLREPSAVHRGESDVGRRAATAGDVLRSTHPPVSETAGRVPWTTRLRHLSAAHQAGADARLPAETAGGVPWATRSQRPAADRSGGREVPVLVPAPGRESRVEAVPFGGLDELALADLVARLRAAARHRPRRRTRRFEVGGSGRLDLRRTAHRWRRTGGEPLHLVRVRQRRRPRRLVVLCDVSESMQPYVTAFLHLMRAASMDKGETFAFGTTLSRLSPALRRRTPAEAVAEASALVGDRYGGTRIAASLRTLLRSHHGELLRGAVVVVASDGWDTDPPQQLAAHMARIARRAHRIVWVNPRAGEPGYRPLAGGMAAALPYCDAVLSAATLDELPQVIDELSSTTSRRQRDGTA